MISAIKQNPSVLKALKQYEMLAARDKMALKALLATLVLLFIYFGLWQPAYQYKKDADMYFQQQSGLLALVTENKSALRNLTKASSSSATLNSQQLVSSVTNLAKQAGITLKRFEPSGDNEIKVWVDDASFDKMMTWLTTMKKTLNVRVIQISVEKSDQPGLVSSRLTLSS